MLLSKEYVACLIDCEGCIRVVQAKRLYGTYYYMTVMIANTYRPILDRMMEQFGGNIWPLPSHPNRQPCFKWQVTGSHSLPVLRYIQGYSIIKEEQARLGLEMAERCAHWRYKGRSNPMPPEEARLRRWYYERVKALKRPDLLVEASGV